MVDTGSLEPFYGPFNESILYTWHFLPSILTFRQLIADYLPVKLRKAPEKGRGLKTGRCYTSTRQCYPHGPYHETGITQPANIHQYLGGMW